MLRKWLDKLKRSKRRDVRLDAALYPHPPTFRMAAGSKWVDTSTGRAWEADEDGWREIDPE